MNAGRPSPGTGGLQRRARPRLEHGVVVEIDRLRIERALAQRTRYRYVQPRVEAVDAGWKVVCANCSRRIDAAGGEIDIARFEPLGDGRWSLLSRDHVHGHWRPQIHGTTLDAALARVCADPLGIYWP